MTHLKQKGYYPALTGLRFVAASMVFLHHYLANHPAIPWLLNVIVSKAFIGINLFFVLSGFLFSHRFGSNADFSKSFLILFFRNRFVRIYPLYFLLTVATLLIYAETNFKTWLVNITLSKSLFSTLRYSGIAQAWSLTIVEMFYLADPLITIWLRRGYSIWWWLLILHSIGFLLVGFSHWLGFTSFMANNHFMLVFTFFGQSFAFLLGMQLSVFLKSNYELRKRWLTIIGCTGLILSSFVWYGLVLVFHVFKFSQIGGVAFHNYFIPVFCVLLIWGLIAEKTILSKVLSSQFFQAAGNASYAFYLLNLGIFAQLIATYIHPNPIVIFGASLVCAQVVHLYFEKPLMKKYG